MTGILNETEELIRIFFSSVRTAERNSENDANRAPFSDWALGVGRWALGVSCNCALRAPAVQELLGATFSRIARRRSFV